MSRALELQWCRRTRQQAWSALRACAALWLVFYIAYTPIHLYLEPHSDGADCSTSIAHVRTGDLVAGHDDGDHHARHPAAQHKFKVTQPTRAPVLEMVAAQPVQWVPAERNCPQPEVFGFSGLSPPELLRCWQFVFRAALPVRAPSLPA